MNLIEGLQEEMDRNRELLQDYKDIGPSGLFGAGTIQDKIKATERAIANGDTVEMLRCFKRLQDSQ